jgi:hypothetical protein
MAEEREQGYDTSYGESFSSLQLSDLEEKHSILKERLLLIGKNLIETKEQSNARILEMRKEMDDMKHDIERIKSFVESISSQMGKFAKKEDLEILARQLKMFRPFAGGG